MSVRTAVTSWLDDRLGLPAVRELAAHKTVPMHRYSVFYYLGGITLFFFMVQVLTGVMLMLYYRPGPDEAFESVEFIVTTVPFGWLIRSIHSWSANLMVFFAFLHMASVYFLKSYRAPRELTWVTGALLMFLALGFGFSGYLLPWNQLAFFATKVGTDVGGAVPLIGEWTVRFLRGGDRVSGATLSRFFGWHVAILPALSFAVLAAHLAFVQMKGMSVPPMAEAESKNMKPMPFFPHFALRDLAGWVLALALLAGLAAFLPWELGEKADLFAPAYEDIKPEWYYIFMFQTLKLVPGGEIFGMEYEAIPIILFGLGGLALTLVPFLDRGVNRTGKSPLFTLAGAGAIIFMVAMTCWGYHSILPLLVLIASAVLILIFAFITRAPRGSAMILALFLVAGTAWAAPPATSCTRCHAGELFDEKARAKVHGFASDVHAQAGLSCHDCHGGNPDPALADDPAAAMDPKFAVNPYTGTPERGDIPAFCGRCHSSADYMKRFNPAARIDQVAEYSTSHHGQALQKGDKNVATCVDCHSVHDIKRHTQPDSPVYPTRVAETCSRCHANHQLMAGYGLPSDQYAKWKASVHAAGLAGGDIAAPTCNDCHGNHGATPPGVESISYVCGQCHAREAELFRKSGKHAAWEEHNGMLAGGAECSDCHEGRRAAVKLAHFSECVSCHENHGVVRPTIALLGDLPETPCAFCHEGSGPLADRIEEPREKARHYQEHKADFLKRAAALGLRGNDRFDWLVDQALAFENHTQKPSRGPVRLRPEFARLFEKFRIGKTQYSYVDAAGKRHTVPVRGCQSCHDSAEGAGTANVRAYVDSTRGLTSMIGRAERILLSAQRGGVEVRKAREQLEGAVDSQIELATLVHTFNSEAVAAKQKEGLQFAEGALVAGRASLEELDYRRNGLFVALGFIALALVALTLKIRSMS